MKKTNLILLLFIIVSSFSYGQNNNLIYPKSTDKSSKIIANDVIQVSPVIKSADFIEIELGKLKDYDLLSLQFDDKKYSVQKDKIKIRGINNFSFFAKNENGDGNIILSVLNNDIQGIITQGHDLYRITTAQNGEYVLTNIDQSKYPEEKCHNILEQDAKSNKKSENSYDSDDEIKSTIDNTTMLKSAAVYECKIRVLVMYTPAAESAVSNIRNTIQLAVDETNQSFTNSNVTYEVELVYVEETSYTEVDIDTDLDRFVTDGDGYMDEVHDLRDTYSADICVLINDDSYWCGVAETIQASEDEAFCVVDYDCATGYYSFGHEIGHLLGCRHDTYVDNSNTPFAYGHGFVNVADRWRTIMAYNSECSASGVNCTRLQYWSNPNVTYGGDAMGTTSTEHCARVWNEESITVMAFRQPETNVTLTGSDVSNSLYADVIATQNIETSGNITVSNGSALNLRAGNAITLQPGFTAELGSEFSASIETVSDCGSTTKSAKIAFEKDNNIIDNIEETNENISYNIYPNPSFETVNINYDLNTKSNVSIALIDFLGAIVMNISANKNLTVGNYNIQFDVADISAGVYFIRMIINDKSITEKIIIK